MIQEEVSFNFVWTPWSSFIILNRILVFWQDIFVTFFSVNNQRKNDSCILVFHIGAKFFMNLNSHFTRYFWILNSNKQWHFRQISWKMNVRIPIWIFYKIFGFIVYFLRDYVYECSGCEIPKTTVLLSMFEVDVHYPAVFEAHITYYQAVLFNYLAHQCTIFFTSITVSYSNKKGKL